MTLEQNIQEIIYHATMIYDKLIKIKVFELWKQNKNPIRKEFRQNTPIAIQPKVV